MGMLFHHPITVDTNRYEGLHAVDPGARVRLQQGVAGGKCAIARKRQDWVGSIAAQGKLSRNGPRLPLEGKVLKSGGVITEGPFVEIRERPGIQQRIDGLS